MIAKRVPRRSALSSPQKLVKYMVAAKGRDDPNSWERTADYVLDTKSHASTGERVGSYRVTNCGTEDPAAATILIMGTQAANKTSKKDKTYHLVYAFPPGENPPLDVLHKIEDELCESIGLADHQRISAVHLDTDHLHVHVAINKVHPTGFQNIEPYYDQKRLMEACERLEEKYGLQRTNHGINKGKSHERNRESIQLNPEQQPSERDSRFRRYLRESYDLQITEKPEAKTYNDLRTLSGRNMARNERGYSMLLQGNARSGLGAGGSAGTPGVRRPSDGDRATSGSSTGVSQKITAIEMQSGIETLAGYVSREVAPAIKAASSWQEVHAALSDHGLEIKQRGAGLVIGDASIPLWAKASTCDRAFSFKSLTDRLGPFETAEQNNQDRTQKTKKGYKPAPKQDTPSSAGLYAQYQRERQAAMAARKKSLAQLRQESTVFYAQLKNWRQAQNMLLRVTARGGVRKLMQSTIRQQAANSRQKHKLDMAAKRQAVISKTSTMAWADWLKKQAENGNEEALAVLRSKQDKAQRWKGNLLTADKAERAGAYVLKSIKPQARKDGSLSYNTVDGGLVIDRTTHVQAQKATTGAALVALDIASKRFDGQPLIVEGTDEFKKEVAQLAAFHNINVTFADPEMERQRQAGAKYQTENKRSSEETKQVNTPAASGTAANTKSEGETLSTPDLVVKNWIAERNKSRDKISSIDYHRQWTPADAGDAIYQGRRSMKDGNVVLLLKRGDEVLVKTASKAVVTKAATKWKVGQTVKTDARGRFIEKTKTKGAEI